MKTKISIFLLIVMLISLIPIPMVSADDPSSFELIPNSDTVDYGDTFDVSVYVSPNASINAIAIDELTFDSDLLNIVAHNVTDNVSKGDIFEGGSELVWYSGYYDNVVGNLTDVGWVISAPGSSDAGYFCNITFEAIGVGVAHINLTDVIVSYGEYPWDYQIISNSTITIESNFVGTVVTNESTGIEETNATLNGYLEDDGGEPCYVRFEYGFTDSYGNETDNQTKETGEEFSVDVTGLSEGSLYHYRAVANDSVGTGNGSDYTFLTKPDPPLSFIAESYNENQINLTWTKGTGANNTYIERNKTGQTVWSLGEGDIVYNNTLNHYEDSVDCNNTIYYYQAWSYSEWGDLHQYSDDYVDDYGVYASTVNLSVNDTTQVEETTVRLNGYIKDIFGEDEYTGFSYDTSSHVLIEDYSNSVTYGATAVNSNFYKDITDLQPGEYYYAKAWVNTYDYSDIYPFSFNDSFDSDLSSQYDTVGTWTGWGTGDLEGPGNNEDSQYAVWRNSTLENITANTYWSVETRLRGYDNDCSGIIVMDSSGNFYSIVVGDDSEYDNDYDGIRYGEDRTKISQFNNDSSIQGDNNTLKLIYNGSSFIVYFNGKRECDYDVYFDVFSIGLYADAEEPNTVFQYMSLNSSIPEHYTFSSNDTYFLTKPYSPTNLSITNSNHNSVTLNWDKTTNVGAGTTVNTVVRYKKNSYPTSPIGTDGSTLAYNGTAESNTTYDLDPDTKYYFSAWTCAYDSGSPTLYQYSDNYDFDDTTTFEGNYNISIRYENRTYGPVDLTTGHNHEFIVHYEYSTEENYFNNTGIMNGDNDSQGYWDSVDDGWFNITVDERPLFFSFHWNASKTFINESGNITTTTYSCHRMIVPDSSQRNITFYIRDDLPVYGDSSYYMNDSLVRYTMSFIDSSGDFTPNNNPYATIYTYDDNGIKQVIHSEYFDSTKRIIPWLVYDKRYYIGVSCDEKTFERISTFIPGDDQSPNVQIPYQYINDFSFHDIVFVEIGWEDDGFFVDVQESTGHNYITSITLYVWWYNNDTIYHDYPDPQYLSSYNFSVSCNNSTAWKYNIKVDVVDTDLDDNLDYSGTYWLAASNGAAILYPGIEVITRIDDIDDIIQIIFGDSPMYDNEGDIVSWTYIGLFGFSFVLLVSFGKINAFVGSLAVGLFLMAAGGWIYGLISIVVGVGGFIIGLSIVGLLGGVDTR